MAPTTRRSQNNKEDDDDTAEWPSNKPTANTTTNKHALAYTSIPHARVAFGRYPFPAEQALSELLASGFTVFIDCTTAACESTTSAATDGVGGRREKKQQSIIQRYSTTAVPVYHSYPVPDQGVPDDLLEFRQFAKACVNNLDPDDKVYVHCRGGHGRAAVVAACLLLQLRVVDTADDALHAVQSAHTRRAIMRERWRQLGCPQNSKQKQFVRRFAAAAAAVCLRTTTY